MPSEIDRRIGGTGPLPVVVAVLIVMAGAAGLYVWHRTSAPALTPGAAAVRIPVRFDEPLAVTLDLPAGGSLSLQQASVKRQPDTQSQAREVLNALLTDPRSAGSPVLSGLTLRAFYLDAAGTAFVDVVPVSASGIRSSAWEELLGVYAIVDTLMANFEGVTGVRFLLEGREAQTLAGHIDLTRTFTRRTDLVRQ